MKPTKPSPDFPLYPHSTGQWAKSINGRKEYFGTWDDPQGALAVYQHWLATGSKDLSVPSADAKAKSARPAKGAPPKPPYRDFPLYAHSNGQWAKKVRGATMTFGPWDDYQAALDKWLLEKDDLLAGRTPKLASSGLTVGGLVNSCLAFYDDRLRLKQIVPRTFSDLERIGKRVVTVFGRNRLVEDLRPDDFWKLQMNFAETHGPVALSDDITKTRTIFKYGADNFQVHPFYGKKFEKPSKDVLRKEKNSKPRKFFEADQIRTLIASASRPLKAMILLGINCGFGNDDCANLQTSHLDLDGGWHNFPRPKTGITRRAPLWPETVAALIDALAVRPKPADPALKNRVFITSKGGSWSKPGKDNPISKEMTKLCKKVKLHLKGRAFYSLRHTFQSVGDGNRDLVAVRYVMGHAPASDDMAARYREQTFEENIVAVSEYVREWLKRTVSSPALLQGKTASQPETKEPQPVVAGKRPRRPGKSYSEGGRPKPR